MISKKNILVIYGNLDYPSRASVLEHLYSFKKYSQQRCYYLNIEYQSILRIDQLINFDLIIFHHLFFGVKTELKVFKKYVEKVRRLSKLSVTKIMLVQDEFSNTDIICDFIEELGINFVFSVAPETEWIKIYPSVDFEKVKFYRVLTGYIDENAIKKIKRLSETIKERPIDIGYRAGSFKPLWGRHNLLKKQIAELFIDKTRSLDLVIDIMPGTEKFLLGEEWYKFLLKCKYVIGVEGGVSLLDLDGSLGEKVRDFIKERPNSSFYEIEESCFPGVDGNIKLFALSPKHLEACITKTCQILIEGTYNGVLVKGRHYIELKSDFSNIDEVISLINCEEVRKRITETAYKEIVASRMYSYEQFVKLIIETSLVNNKRIVFENLFFIETTIYYWMIFTDKVSCFQTIVIRTLRRYLQKILPIKWQDYYRLLKLRQTK